MPTDVIGETPITFRSDESGAGRWMVRDEAVVNQPWLGIDVHGKGCCLSPQTESATCMHEGHEHRWGCDALLLLDICKTVGRFG